MTETDLEPLLDTSSQIFIQQKKEWIEILSDWETANKYQILTPTGGVLGYITEAPKGLSRFLMRSFLGSRRPFEIHVLNQSGREVLQIRRRFFFFLSRLEIFDVRGTPLGSVQRRWAFFHKEYDLIDDKGQAFAHVRAPIWKIWTFPIFNCEGQPVGSISKKWQGLFKEAFTDSDQFGVDFGASSWSLKQRSILLAAAISIDFDFFENNQSH